MQTTAPPAAPTNGAALPRPAGVTPRPDVKRWWLLAAALGLAVLAAAGVFALRAFPPAAPSLVTVPVVRGTLVRTVTASGTINPQDQVSIGSQISGTISEVAVDYNSVVTTGQVLARIDPTAFQASLDQALAQLAQTAANARQAAAGAQAAQAAIAVQHGNAAAASQSVNVARANATAQASAVTVAQANLEKAQSALVLAQQTMDRDASLLGQGYVAQNVVDADRAALATAQSGVTAAQGSLTQAAAQAAASAQSVNQAIAQSQSQGAQNLVAGAQAQAALGTADAQSAGVDVQDAQVRTARYNLAHTTITSPVNGTVIARSVSLGQTVAASFSTPTLFTIARDLSKMQAELAVGEPDIGAVVTGAPVTFTVLAYPQSFTGIVLQVRQNPTIASNVVTYTTVVAVDNRQGLLRPGMTANALVQTGIARDALLVPEAALEWAPSAAVAARFQLAPPAPAGNARGSRFGVTSGAGATTLASGSAGRIYVRRGDRLTAVAVRIVLTSATQAAVAPVGAGLQAGDEVVTGDGTGKPVRAGATGLQTAPGFGGNAPGGGATRGIR